jgi:DNA-binding IclR family transcriptional regulator
MENSQQVNALGKGLRVLDILYDRGEIGVSELGTILKLNRSSAYRILLTLEQGGFVEQVHEGGKYKLGLKLAKFHAKVLLDYDIREKANPFLARLTKLTGEASGLSIMSGDKAILIDKCSGVHQLSVKLEVGMIEDMNYTAHGKALLSAFDEVEQRRLLSAAAPFKKLTAKTLIDIEDIIADARRNKERGYAVDNEEGAVGMRCVASNVYDYKGRLAAAIGVSCPSIRVGMERIDEVVAAVKQVAEELSNRLGN